MDIKAVGMKEVGLKTVQLQSMEGRGGGWEYDRWGSE